MTENDMVSVADVARELGTHKQTIFKVMRRLGIGGTKRRDTSRGNQEVSYITRSECKRVRTELGGLSSGVYGGSDCPLRQVLRHDAHVRGE